jgi:chaperone required for assembly of F1-ATPase
MIDGACVIALATSLGAVGSPLRLAAVWAVCSLVVSIVVGFLLHGRGSS